jgi:hypothetical protein
MMNKLRNWLKKPITLVPLIIVCCLVSMAAGRVNGLFNNVDAQGGYTLNGTAGTSGYALCTSTGSKFDSACATGGTISSVSGTSPITVTPTTGAPVVSLNESGVGPAAYACPTTITFDVWGRATAATAGTCLTSTPLTSGTNGYYEILSNGTIINHVNISSLPNDNSYDVYALPYPFTSFVASIACSTYRPGGNPGPVGAEKDGLSNIQLLSNTGGSGTLMNASCVVTGK